MAAVTDGRTFEGLVEFEGFGLYQHRVFQLAGMELPNLRSCPPAERRKAEQLHEYADAVLRMLLLGDRKGAAYGRRIVVSPETPDKFGRVYTHAYVPCKREQIMYPNLTVSVAKMRFLNVCNTMREAMEQKMTLGEVQQLVDSIELHDFAEARSQTRMERWGRR